MRSEMAKLRDETDESFAEVRTEQQKSKYRERPAVTLPVPVLNPAHRPYEQTVSAAFSHAP
jgi:hypothetical protein